MIIIPDGELCIQDEFGYCHRIDVDDIEFIADYSQIREWITPGIYMTIRDLMLHG